MYARVFLVYHYYDKNCWKYAQIKKKLIHELKYATTFFCNNRFNLIGATSDRNNVKKLILSRNFCSVLFRTHDSYPYSMTLYKFIFITCFFMFVLIFLEHSSFLLFINADFTRSIFDFNIEL